MPWTFPYFGETQTLNDDVRARTPGSFIKLSEGWTHYELSAFPPLPLSEGPGVRAVPVVLVHGFSVPYFIWDPTFEFLTASGFCALRYDLFGRGFSDRPNLRYDIDLFCKQLRELTDILGFKQFDLIGLSLGGSISANFTANYPVRVRKLALIDPAGVRSVTPTRVLKALTAPGFGELAIGLFGRGSLSRGVKSDFYEPGNIKAFVQKYLVPMKYKGFLRALLSTLRSGALGGFPEAFRKIGAQGTPTLLFWGREDKTVPFSHSQDLLRLIPQAELHVFERCGHIPHYEKPEEANPLLLEFLQ